MRGEGPFLTPSPIAGLSSEVAEEWWETAGRQNFARSISRVALSFKVSARNKFTVKAIASSVNLLCHIDLANLPGAGLVGSRRYGRFCYELFSAAKSLEDGPIRRIVGGATFATWATTSSYVPRQWRVTTRSPGLLSPVEDLGTVDLSRFRANTPQCLRPDPTGASVGFSPSFPLAAAPDSNQVPAGRSGRQGARLAS